MRPLLFALVLLAPVATATGASAAAESRIALVIGNEAYKDSPLANPVNDAKAVSAALRAAGFEVIERHNQGAVEMRRAIREFGEKLRGKGAGLFYFAGHGVQVNGRNFLIPANADIRYEDEIEDQSVDVSLVLGKMESAKARINLVILDACRNNPFVRGSRSAQQGLAAMEAPIGSLIAYATSPGQVASDGLGKNGLYTEYLVREIERPGLKVEDVFKRVRAAVRQASNGRQVPWENTSLEGDFYFRPGESAEAAVSMQEARRRQEAEIQRAVAEALSRSKEEAERERKRLEAAFAEKLETERESFRRDALERIAAAEKAAQVAASRPASSFPAPPPAPVQAAQAAAPAAKEPAAAPAAEEPGDPILLAMAADVLDSKLKPVSDAVARALEPPPRLIGDRWVYQREIRDGEALTRRNYLTLTVIVAGPKGFEVETSDSALPLRHDPDGNLLSMPAKSGGLLVFEPLDPRFRFPLKPGDSWSAQSQELFPEFVKEADNRVTVLGWESLTVPAGTFQALKVSKVANKNWSPFPGQSVVSKRVTHFWYVPALRTFARYETLEVTQRGEVIADQSWELDSFKLN
jgi:uncharacterized caspase-like protein